MTVVKAVVPVALVLTSDEEGGVVRVLLEVDVVRLAMLVVLVADVIYVELEAAGALDDDIGPLKVVEIDDVGVTGMTVLEVAVVVVELETAGVVAKGCDPLKVVVIETSPFTTLVFAVGADPRVLDIDISLVLNVADELSEEEETMYPQSF